MLPQRVRLTISSGNLIVRLFRPGKLCFRNSLNKQVACYGSRSANGRQDFRGAKPDQSARQNAEDNAERLAHSHSARCRADQDADALNHVSRPSLPS